MTRLHRYFISAPLAWIALFAVCAVASAQAPANAVYGIAPYPGSTRTGIESAEKLLLSSGYALAVCRRSTDSIEKVVAHFRKDKQLQFETEGLTDLATFSVRGRVGAAVQINSPWMDSATFVMQKDTLICVAGRTPN